MKVTKKELPKNEVSLTIEVPAEALDKYKKQAAAEISQQVKIPGFRPGKVPFDVLEQKVSKEAIMGRVIEIAIPQAYAEAVLSEKVQVITRPKIEVKSENPLTFEATVATMPPVTIKGYEKIKTESKEVKVGDKDIQEVITNIQNHQAQYNIVDRALQDGDRAEIDFEGFDEKGTPLEGTKSKHHPVLIGDKTFIPGFEEELIGLKKGDDKEFKITFPKDYHKADFQNKKVTFKVHVHEVEERVLPELNEEFIEKITGEKKDLAALKKQIEENLVEQKTQEEKTRRENDFLEKLISVSKADLSDMLVEDEVNEMIHEHKHELKHRGLSWEQFLEATKKTEEDVKKEKKEEATKRITLRLALQELFKQEEIKVEEKEMQEEVDKIKAMYPPKEMKKFEKRFKKGTGDWLRLENKMKMEKMFAKLLK